MNPSAARLGCSAPRRRRCYLLPSRALLTRALLTRALLTRALLTRALLTSGYNPNPTPNTGGAGRAAAGCRLPHARRAWPPLPTAARAPAGAALALALALDLALPLPLPYP
eukprot:scaffold26400_cov38-Phaeocystis_antarctica.AAC.1